MKTALIFGSTNTGRQIYKQVRKEIRIIGFVDQVPKKWGGDIDGIKIYSPEFLKHVEFDYIYIGVLTFYLEVMEVLRALGIPGYKIVDKYVSLPTYARVDFLEKSRILLDQEEIVEGNVAELGVYKGEFAKEINRVFFDRRLYLFDTFGGFDSKDDEIERDKGFSDRVQQGYFADTTVELVMSKMKFPDLCIVKKGFFPDTVKGVEDKFCFVNIDADLYAPILSGLEWFYQRMIPGGIILVHDYYSTAFTGARQAVNEFSNANNVLFIPVGDTLSVALRKPVM